MGKSEEYVLYIQVDKMLQVTKSAIKYHVLHLNHFCSTMSDSNSMHFSTEKN